MRAIIITIALLTLSGCHYGHGHRGYYDGGYYGGGGGGGGYHGDRHHRYSRGDYDRHRGPGDHGSRYWRR